MKEKGISIMLRTEDGELWQELAEIVSSIEGVRLPDPMDEGPWDIFFTEVGEDPDKAFSLIRDMQSTARAEHFFLTSRDASPEVLIQAIRMGVRGFFPQPVSKQEIRGAIMKIKEEKFREDLQDTIGTGSGKIINVLGTKGGIGTTTIAVNLAAGIAGLEEAPSVVLVDMNLHFGDVPLFLGMEPVFDWGEVVKNISRLDKTYLMSILQRHPSGIHVLPAPARAGSEYQDLEEGIEELFKIMQLTFDYVVVDNGQSLDGISRTVARMSDTLLLVATLNLPSLINTRKLQGTLQQLGLHSEDCIKVVVNRLGKNSDITLREGEKSISRKVFFTLPNDYDTTMRAINLGRPIRMTDQGSEIGSRLSDLAHAVAGKEEKRKQVSFFRQRRH